MNLSPEIRKNLSDQNAGLNPVAQQDTDQLRALYDTQMDRFSNVFETESGSRYYVTSDGGSYRIRSKNQLESPGTIERVTYSDRIFFLTEESAFLAAYKLESRVEQFKINIAQCPILNWLPIEFTHKNIGKIVSLLRPDKAKIRYVEEPELTYHIGNRISKILK